MPEVNFDWVRQQMQEAKVKVGPGNAILALLEAWAEQKLSPALAEEAVKLFSKLALNEAIYTEQAKDEVWAQAESGFITVGDEVRVKANAFTDAAGAIHNGRKGKVVAIRYGDVIFTSTDNREPFLDGVHYAPARLEKRVG